MLLIICDNIGLLLNVMFIIDMKLDGEEFFLLVGLNFWLGVFFELDKMKGK